jgi:hypothetical protein
MIASVEIGRLARVRSRQTLGLIRQQHPQVAKVLARRTGHNRVAQSGK